MIRLFVSLFVLLACVNSFSAEKPVLHIENKVFTPEIAKEAVEKNLGGALFYVRDLIAKELCFRGSSKDVYHQILEVLIENSGDESCRESNYTKDEISYSNCRMEYTRYAISIPRCEE